MANDAYLKVYDILDQYADAAMSEKTLDTQSCFMEINKIIVNELSKTNKANVVGLFTRKFRIRAISSDKKEIEKFAEAVKETVKKLKESSKVTVDIYEKHTI